MPRVSSVLLTSAWDWFRSRFAMQLELIALRHQVAVYKQNISQPKLQPSDRWLWVWLSRLWPGLAGCPGIRPTSHRAGLAEEALPRLLETLEPEW